MSSYHLNRAMTGQQITRLRAKIHDFLKTVPGVGEQVIKFARKAEESLKGFVLPGMLFEELGFKYVGPLEGHRLDNLIKNLENVRTMERPVLVHVITKKGKDTASPRKVSPGSTGSALLDNKAPRENPSSRTAAKPSYTAVFGDMVLQLARENPAIVAITAAMTGGTGLDRFAIEIPERFYDVGIAEQHGVTFAAGLATEGFVPIVAIYSTFLQRAYDQVLHDVCLQKLPVVFALDRGRDRRRRRPDAPRPL